MSEVASKCAKSYTIVTIKIRKKPTPISVASIFLIIFIVVIGFGAYAQIQKNSAESTRPRLVFSDEFSSAAIDKDVWSTCYYWYRASFDGCTNYGNNELQWYRNYQTNIEDGHLVLTAKKEGVLADARNGEEKYYPYTSGMISTGATKDSSKAPIYFRYGYFEAHAYAPEGKGLWSAFWLLPNDETWPPEIDIMEILGDRPNELLNTYFVRDSNGNVDKNTSTHSSVNKLAGEWHTYGLDWQNGRIDWYLDGEKVRSVSSDSVPDEKMILVFNLAVGGDLPGSPDEKTVFPSSMLVDYVRVYDKKY